MVVAVCLGLIAGFVDAYGYLHWHVFGANMTGNTVIFAIELFHDSRDALFPLSLIAAFFVGSIAGRVLATRTSASVTMLFEALCLTLAAFFHNPGALDGIAFAMGMQNVSIEKFAGVRANTSFVTGDYSRLGSAIADVALHRGGDEARRTIAILGQIIVAYAAGAMAAAGLIRVPLELLLVVPVAIGVACFGLPRLSSENC